MKFYKLHRTWSNGYANYIPRFKEVFPELKHLNSEELCDRFIDLDMEFYYTKKETTNFWVRLTFPFALILIILLFIFLPICFIFTGSWTYPLSKYKIGRGIINWFKSLRLD